MNICDALKTLPHGENPRGTFGYPYLCPSCGFDNLGTDQPAVLKFDFKDTNMGFDPARWVWWELIKCKNCKEYYVWHYSPR